MFVCATRNYPYMCTCYFQLLGNFPERKRKINKQRANVNVYVYRWAKRSNRELRDAQGHSTLARGGGRGDSEQLCVELSLFRDASQHF